MIEIKLDLIKKEICEITKHKKNIAKLSDELNEFSPYSVGQRLIGNGWTHNGKTFIVERTFVSPIYNEAWRAKPEDIPRYFIATGSIIKKNGKKGTGEVWHTVLISDAINKDNKQ